MNNKRFIFFNFIFNDSVKKIKVNNETFNLTGIDILQSLKPSFYRFLEKLSIIINNFVFST